MATAQNQKLNIAVQSWFKTPVLLQEAGMEEVAKKILEKFTPFGLHPLGIVLNTGDRLYSYGLNFSLFNNQGHFSLTSEKLEIRFESARDQKDLDLIFNCILGVHSCISPRTNTSHFIHSDVHAAFQDEIERTKFLEMFSKPQNGITKGGVIAYAPAGPSGEEVRFSIDHSILFPNSIFVSWNMTTIATLNLDLCQGIQEGFRTLAGKFDLVISLK